MIDCLCFNTFSSIDLGQYTCQIDDDRGIKTSGYLYVEGKTSK